MASEWGRMSVRPEHRCATRRAVGGPEFAALLLPDVQELLTNGAVRPIVRKKAALALLRLLRKSTSDVEELLQHDVRRKPPYDGPFGSSRVPWKVSVASSSLLCGLQLLCCRPRSCWAQWLPCFSFCRSMRLHRIILSPVHGECLPDVSCKADRSGLGLQVWSVKINALFEEPNLGVLLGTVTLLLGIVSRNYEGYEAAVPKVRIARYSKCGRVRALSTTILTH